MEIRPIRDDADRERVVAIINRVYPDDPIGVVDFVAWGKQARERQDLVAERDGTIVGGSRTYLESERPNPWVHIWIAPEERRQGAGAALFAETSRWAAERGVGGFEAWVRENDTGSLAFATGFGFAETGRERGLVLDLTAIEAPAVDAPEGIELTTWAKRPETAPGLYEVYADAILDVPGEEESEVEIFDEWLRRDMQSAGDRADATFVALAGEEVVGYAKLAFSSAQATTAHHDLTGVKRAWRGRGIARALKAAQIRWCKEQGYEELRTRNEDRNAPIRKLNERFGYRHAVGRIYLRGPIFSGS
ncbi:MAG: GNAT family N-acetyltransferase [Actinomycetota bacterium]|nr:GNAT family N-acetyltransferase [Actinomycetota bacterium]